MESAQFGAMLAWYIIATCPFGPFGEWTEARRVTQMADSYFGGGMQQYTPSAADLME